MSEPVYTPNSHKYKEQQKAAATEEKRVQQIVKGPVRTKTNEVRKFADIFISEDIANVKEYIFMDVLVPAIKKAIYDIVTNGIDMFLYGNTGRSKGNSATHSVSYGKYYEQKNGGGYRGSENVRAKDSFSYDDIVFDNRGEAEAVKQQLKDIVARYGMATVNDLYEMTPLTPPYTAAKYGWVDVSNVEVIRVRDGYVLKLPKAMPID